MVISGGDFAPDILKPKEVVTLLLDDEEMAKRGGRFCFFLVSRSMASVSLYFRCRLFCFSKNLNEKRNSNSGLFLLVCQKQEQRRARDELRRDLGLTDSRKRPKVWNLLLFFSLKAFIEKKKANRYIYVIIIEINIYLKIHFNKLSNQ